METHPAGEEEHSASPSLGYPTKRTSPYEPIHPRTLRSYQSVTRFARRAGRPPTTPKRHDRRSPVGTGDRELCGPRQCVQAAQCVSTSTTESNKGSRVSQGPSFVGATSFARPRGHVE